MNSLQTSYGLPRVPAHLVLRRRLIETFDPQAGLVIIQGPGGAGKTTLMTQLVEHRLGRAYVLWVNVAGHQTGRKPFWRAVLETLQEAESESAPDAVNVDFDEILGEPEDFRERLVAVMGGLPACTLVVDDLHRVNDPEIFADLTEILLRCPAVKMIVGSRTVTPLSDPLLAARLDVLVIDAEELKFDVAETLSLLTDTGVAQAADLAPTVHEAASGLALPSRLIAVALRRNPGASPSEISRQLADAGTAYLDDLLRREPAEGNYGQFLRETSVAEELTAELAERLVPQLAHAELLRKVEAGGFGTVRSGPHGERFRYTAVVRTALRSQLKLRDPDRYRELRRTAAEWELEFGDPYLALVISVDIDDLQLATVIVKRAWIELLRFHLEGVISTTESIGRWRLRNYPIIAMLIALAHNSTATGRFRALEYFAIAAGAARLLRSRFGTSDQIILLTLESVALRFIGQVARAQSPAEQAMALLDAHADIARDDLPTLLPTLYSHNGISLFYTGNFGDAMRAFESAHSSAVDTGNTMERHHAIALKAGAAALMGNIGYARLVVDRLQIDGWPASYEGGYLATFYHVARTLLRLEDFDFEGAATELDHMNDEIRTNEHRGVLLHVRALVKLGQNEFHHGAKAIGTAMAADPALRRLDPRTQATLRVTAATLLTAAGEYDDARNTLSAIPSRFRPLGLVCAARIAALTGDLAEAKDLLAGVHDEDQLMPREQAEIDLVRASVAWRSQDLALAASSFSRAMANLAENHMRFPLMLIPGEDLHALFQAYETPSMAGIFTRPVPNAFRGQVESVRLTRREAVVIGYLSEDFNAREIAAKLFVSVNTVKSQMQSLYKKLGVRSREEAIAKARQLNLLPPRAEEGAADGP